MEIIFLSPHSDPQANLGEPDSGGQCVYEHELAIALSQIENIRVTTFCRRKFNYPEISQINPNYRIQRITCGGEKFVRKEDMETVLPEFIERILDIFTPTKDTIVHAHYWDGAKAALLLKYRSGINFPIVWTPHSLGIAKRQTFHTPEDETHFNLIPRITWENYIVLLADAIHVSSDGEYRKLVENYYANPEKLAIIPPGVNTSVLYQLDKIQSRQHLELPLNDKLIITAGRLTPEKGYHHAIHAFASIPPEIRQAMKLVIIGGTPQTLGDAESAYLISLELLVEDLNLGDNVIFRRAVDHIRMGEVYSAADVFLCLSEYEPFGLTVIEAMSIGTATIATRNGGPSDIITHSYDGYLVDCDEHKTIGMYIEDLLTNTNRLENITTRAKETVNRRFKWEIKARECIQNYQRLLEQSDSTALNFMKNTPFLRHNL